MLLEDTSGDLLYCCYYRWHSACIVFALIAIFALSDKPSESERFRGALFVYHSICMQIYKCVYGN